MTHTPHAHIAPYLSPGEFLSAVAGVLEHLRPNLQGRHHFLSDLLAGLNIAVLDQVALAVAGRTFVLLPLELSPESIAAIQEKCRTIRFKSSLPEYALAYLLYHLRQMDLFTCPMPRIRLDTERDLAASFHPDRLWFWPRTEEWWKNILEESLTTNLPQSRKSDRDEIRLALNEAAYVALLGLIMEGDLLLSHQIDPLTRVRVTDLDIDHGFLQIPWVPRRHKKISELNQEEAHPHFLTEPFWLPPVAQLLLLRYIRMRLLWGPRLEEPLVLTDPRSHIYHRDIRAHPNKFIEWLKSHPTTFRPYKISAELAPSIAGRKGGRSLLGQLIDARRAHRATTVGPIFTAFRSRLIVTRPPTIDSWGRVILGKQLETAKNSRKINRQAPVGVAPPVVTNQAAGATNSRAGGSKHCLDHEAVLSASRPTLQPLQQQVNSLLRLINKETVMSERRSLARRIEDLVRTLPLLPASHGCSKQAPLSNFRVQLEWLVNLLGTRYPGTDGLAPISVRNYYGTVQARLVDALGALNILSLSSPDHVAEVVGDMLEDALGGETLRTQRSHFVRLFAFLQLNYGVPGVDLSNDELWVGTEVHPFPILSPGMVDAYIDQLSPPDNIATILGSYGMVRRGELSRLVISDLVGSPDNLYLSIWTSKTRAGIRRVPLWALIPARHRQTLLAYRNSRYSATPSSRVDMEPLLVDEDGQHFTESGLGDRIRARMSRAGLDITSLHPLRHQGASWFPLVWYCAFHQLPANTLGFNFTHPLFSEEHLAQFRQLFLPLPHGVNDVHQPCETDPFHVLSRIMGHSAPLTSVQRYVHTLSFLEYVLMQDRHHVPAWLDRLTRTEAARLLVCSPSEITRRFKAATGPGGPHVDKQILLFDVLDKLRTSVREHSSNR